MSYFFTRDLLNRLDVAHLEEWVLGNGLGGFSAGSIINASFRKQHGYLIAAKKAPINRYLILTRTEERISIDGSDYDLCSQKYSDHFKRGDQYMESFSLDEVVTYRYLVKGISLEKTIAPQYGHNTVAITYLIKTGADRAQITITPLFNHRSHSDISVPESLRFRTKIAENTVILTPESDPETEITFQASTGSFLANDQVIDAGFYYDFEAATGDPRTDAHFKPVSLTLDLAEKTETKIGFVCTIEKLPDLPAEKIIAEYRARAKRMVKQAGYEDDFINRLVLATDSFVCWRESTKKHTILAGLPWFTDWGRDTMISFEGIMLTTKRFAEAKEILESFAEYEKNGLIPNMFPDDGQQPYYNTADASLWYIHAIDRYLQYTNDYESIRSTLYPCMKSIVEHYKNGTDFSIHMDKDSLIIAGSGLDQVTWMDVRVGEEVITPRHGKPVEINALWYNALRVMARLAKHYHEDSFKYRILAEKVKFKFNEKFWNRTTQCLYDVVDKFDASIRPNQLFAISLPFSPLSKWRARKVLNRVTNDLYDSYGIRTLTPTDPRFKAVYAGSLDQRDHAYHMGTAWAYLMGAYVDALLKVNDHSEGACKQAKKVLLNFDTHLHQGCLNGIAEIFDGFHGTLSRGCYSQAWSVAEVLRAYVSNHLDQVGIERK